MKAQVTLFIIIGLFILVSFSVLMYFWMYQSVSEPSANLPGQSFKRMVVDSARAYVNSCLAETSAQALEFLGKQGGRLYVSQGGTYPDPVSFVSRENFKVSYSIAPPEGVVGDYTSEIPDYPWVGFPWIDEDGKKILWSYGYYGLPEFPPLYEFSNGSIQAMLETYVEHNIQKCVDWSSFKGLSFDAGIPDVRMIIAKNLSQLYTEEFVSFDLNWPITIIDSDGSKTELRDFVANYPVSFGRIYYNAKSLIDSDVSDVLFDPLKYEGFDISVVKDVNLEKDDIIVFSDRNSRLIGRPFSFWIARKNRAPALVLVNSSVWEKSYCQGTKFDIDGTVLRATAGQLAYPLQAFDPDEDVVSFSLYPENPHLVSSQTSFKIISKDNAGLEDYQEITVHGVLCK